MPRWHPPLVAIVGASPMEAVQLATPLRRAGISTETFFTGNLKKQLSRASDVSVAVVVKDGLFVRNMETGAQRAAEAETLVAEVIQALIGEK